MRKSFLSSLAILLASSAVPVIAQQSVLTLRVQQGQNIFQVANGQTLNFASTGIGQPSVLTLTGMYTGATTLVISSQPQILGSTDFSIDSIGSLPVTLMPGGTFKLDITYTPTTASTAVAQLVINFAQTAAVATNPPQTGNITLNLNGQVPNLSVDYLLPPANNVTPILNGGTITFPSTLVNTTTTATIVVANTGTGPSTINSVSVSGTAFQLQSLGLLPATIPAGSTVSFTLKYSPVTPETDSGILTIVLPNQTFTINLTGTATSAIVTYQEINGQNISPLTVGQQITLPDTPVGTPSSVAIQVQNTGTAPTTINSVTVSGNGFTVTNLPVLPITLAPGGLFSFNLNYTPNQVGNSTGTLTIGADRFLLSGSGLGAQLTYAYSSGGSSVPVTPAGTILFSSAALAQSSTVAFSVTNTGSSAATITSIGITGGAAAAFTLPNLPALPTTLAPGATYRFTINFSPVTQGLNTANLVINSVTFLLSGFGTTAPALPQYQITGLSSQAPPFTQPAFGLSLAQPYPLDVNGVLTMGVNSTVFVTDPAVQFATGGRSVTFTIPAGSTQATFSNGATQLQIQTGTVAETISLVAAFTTMGGVSVTSPNPAAVTVTIPPSAPTLLSVSQQNFTPTGFNIVVTGFSTTRTLGKLTLQFNPMPGLSFKASSFAMDVSEPATFWFNSAGSQAFGGIFQIAIPITATVPGATANSTATLAGQFTVTATVTNSVGTSNPVTQ